MPEPSHADLQASIATVTERVAGLRERMDEIDRSRRDHLAIIYGKLETLEKAAHIETGKKALKATLWTAVAGAAGAGIHAVIKLIDSAGGGMPPPPNPWTP
ncbi:MAG: hypothetical protein AB7E70_20895 [Hyphomicrobiaceae bacterium]